MMAAKRTSSAADSRRTNRNSSSSTGSPTLRSAVMPDRLIEPVGPEDHVRGAEDAELELVMYGDFECPYCAAAQSILDRVQARLDGRLRFVFRHFPLDEVHPHARQAAEAAEAAAAQGRFWEMHDALYAARGRLIERDLLDHARVIGLDVAE